MRTQLSKTRERLLRDAAQTGTAEPALTKRIETLTDELAAPAYDALSADELDELTAGLEQIAAAV